MRRRTFFHATAATLLALWLPQWRIETEEPLALTAEDFGAIWDAWVKMEIRYDPPWDAIHDGPGYFAKVWL